MEPKFVLGTFYTIDTPYQDVCSEYFLDSAIKLGVSHGVKFRIYTRPNQNSWTKNVAEKPSVILDMLNTLKYENDNRILVFMDADATIEKYPVLFDNIPEDADIGFHRLDWKTWYNKESDVKELLTGTMFFRNNDKIRNILTKWYNDAIISNQWEQKILQKIIESDKTLNIYELPVEYCYINTLPNGQKPYVQCEPVIIHHQASRKLKKVIGK